MKAVVSAEPGGPETLSIIEQETPAPGPGQALISIKASGVNFPDTLIIRDLYQFRPERPFTPGGEAAGVVEAVGDGVTALKVGDRVLASMLTGGYATHAVVDQTTAVKIPDAMPFDEAAGFLMTYGTSHHALKDRARIKEGETLFILGAAGGVGSAAIELGKAMGAKVIAGVSSDEKAAFCKELGADAAIVYPKGDLDRDAQKQLSNDIKAAAKDLGGADGVDVVYDAVGGAYAEPAVRALAWEGRFLVVGFPAGIPKLPLNLTLLKGCQIVGVFWGAFVMRDPKAHGANLKEMMEMYAAGKIRPRVTARYPLEDAAQALRDVEERKATGKIVLTSE
ncbi:MAG: NADPH:quinone oxidoreductase family protein [Pseudomonadota bacterium]